MRFVELFAGIGGFSLGFERAGMECVGHVEIDPYAQKVLLKHWPDVPLYPDVTKIKGDEFGQVDLLCGGFPCQPFSSASRGRISAISMWPEFQRIISVMRPKIVVVENVSKKAINQVKIGMEGLNYGTKIRRIGAHEIGADHKRNRWWLCAYSDNESKLSVRINEKMAELPKIPKGVWEWENYARAIRISDGLSNRMDRLKCLGNALVPQIAQFLGERILDAEQRFN